MSLIIGEWVRVVSASDRTQVGVNGTVVLESANMITIEDLRMKRVQKKGTILLLRGTKDVITGEELSGRLEDRLERTAKR